MNTDEQFQNKIHPSAKSILTSEFYWNLDNPNGPFSLNRVSNTFGEFVEWRNENQTKSILDYFPEIGSNELIFDRNRTDIESIISFYKVHYELQKSMFSQYGNIFDSTSNGENGVNKISTEQQNEIIEQTARQMGETALKEHDDMVISIGFGQFITEGTIDQALKLLTEKAIQRQLTPFVLDQFEDIEYRNERKQEFEIMLNDLSKIK